MEAYDISPRLLQNHTIAIEAISVEIWGLIIAAGVALIALISTVFGNGLNAFNWYVIEGASAGVEQAFKFHWTSDARL